MKNKMKRPKFFIIFLMLCATSAWGDELPDSVSTSADVAGMSWEKADSASSGGILPGMGWDTTATTQIFVADRNIKPAARRFMLQGFTVQNQFRGQCGIFLENKRKIIIKQ
ncbi:MAG: hypothetical protein E7070_01610 [Bacteroidales bacterium]|jgi:hypothetical protein|nr:hypothetical protein [Bacteroidales bacterium]